ncbi:MAG: GNAT family N-acetyltransferase, partial [Cyanobacteria bacterium REEB67]|nr:GNAT family N-acetyltransferase [Cyanobacteria bacterium REEB67]
LPGYFILADGERAGIVGFQRIAAVGGKQAVAISINLDPKRRSKGLGAEALKAIQPLLKAQGVQIILAEIQTTNPASRKAFEKAGFKYHDQYSRLLASGETVVVERLTVTISESFCLPGSNRAIGEGEPCFVVAEAGSNWKIGTAEENNKTARRLIDVAKEAGCDAVKFQTFKAKSTYVSNAGDSDYLRESGEVRNVFDLLKELEMPYEMVLELAEYARQVDITFLTTAFSVDDLNAIDKCVPIHKIASYENSHLRLLQAAAATGKPTMMSTGASPIDEIDWSVDYFRQLSAAPLILMQCTAAYPAPRKALNLRTIPTLRSRYDCLVGLSDHSKDPIAAPIMAIALGASALEKHFTLDNNLPGPDHQYAIEPPQLKAMMVAIREAEESLGDGFKQVAPEEQELFRFAKRSLQALVDLKPGDVLTEDKNFGILRPGSMSKGMHPRHLAQVAGRPVKKPVAQGSGLTFDHLLDSIN